MKNKLEDLNDHLFAQMERLGDESLSKESLEKEISRTRAITGVSNEIVSNARLALDVEKFKDEIGLTPKAKDIPQMLENKSSDDES
ncbi:hypothetical protein F9L16_23015 [Agarivorans sp. B2Z047]|uniref:hypothetical protein n=1 Tax=Agarivorans sp. B2Z047 TaxID=2652721 RepID=UPI00128E1D50|nr:hypothetical protein [Agarivorans sp. B2Z047]MPW31840.1 hypothetical protein [Agarivorans sp. B2Z047]UQN41921.1 hypothetical protein LQZ07_19395 [Agarivorans sp. B2Z047]